MFRYYCDAPLLANVTEQCDAGFYCEVGASKANGSDSGKGSITLILCIVLADKYTSVLLLLD